MNSKVVKLAYQSIINYLGGNFDEYQRLVNMAIELNNSESEIAAELNTCLVGCKYKIAGEWHPARIDFSTGVIADMNGKILRRGHIVC